MWWKMDADLKDLHPSLRSSMLKDKEYLKTQTSEQVLKWSTYDGWDEAPKKRIKNWRKK